jgi:hypothetical protein
MHDPNIKTKSLKYTINNVNIITIKCTNLILNQKIIFKCQKNEIP